MATFTKRVTSANDGGFEQNDSSWWSSGYTPRFGSNGDPVDAGFRWTAVTIPQGAKINSAKITLTAFNSMSWTVYTRIKGVAEDNTPTYSNSNRPSQRSKVASTVDWTPPSFTAGNNYDTPSLTSIVQNIVDRVGWASGNAMGIVIEDNGTSAGSLHWKDSYDYGSDPSKTALLTIDYTPPTNINVNDSQAQAENVNMDLQFGGGGVDTSNKFDQTVRLR